MTRRVRKYGFTDFGHIQIPPLPQNIVLQGRDDMVFYFLTQAGSPGTLTLLLSTVTPTHPDTIFYGPYAGPYLNGNLRLFVSGGVLQGELVAEGGLVFNQRILTRRGNEATLLEITAQPSWKPGNAFTLTEIVL